MNSDEYNVQMLGTILCFSLSIISQYRKDLLLVKHSNYCIVKETRRGIAILVWFNSVAYLQAWVVCHGSHLLFVVWRRAERSLLWAACWSFNLIFFPKRWACAWRCLGMLVMPLFDKQASLGPSLSSIVKCHWVLLSIQKYCTNNDKCVN